ncbi:MAG TPA: bifunctional nuclease domain-containing protein [Anaeromyxobacter sp.]
MSRLAVWPLASLGLAATLAAGTAGGGRPDPDARVELEVAGLLPMGEGAGTVLVLREKGAQTLLPLLVPAPGAGDHEGELRSPGLLGQAIAALGARVTEVEIDRAEETRTGAKVRLAQGERSVELRGRPSESVSLAISAKAPIVTTRRLLDESGLSPEDLAKAKRKVRSRGERL